MHEVHAGGAALLLGVAAPQRVHHVAGEDEEEVGGAAVADGTQCAQGHEHHVHPVRELEQAPDAPPLAAATRGRRSGVHLYFLHSARMGSGSTSQPAPIARYALLCLLQCDGPGSGALYSTGLHARVLSDRS